MSARSQTRPQPLVPNALHLGIHRYFEVSLFAMIVTGFIALAGTGKLDPVSLLFVLAALGIRAYHFAVSRAFTLTEKTTSRLTIAYMAFYPLDFYFVSGRDFVSATVRLVLFIMVVKMFSVQRDRDHVYLAIISFLMILAAAVLTVDSFFLGAFCVFLLLTVSTFISMEMRRSLNEVCFRIDQPDQRDQPANSQNEVAGTFLGILPGAPAEIPKKLAKSLSATSVLLVAGMVLGATFIFFILPRLSTGYLTNLSARNTFVAGFSDEVKLGAIGRIQQSDSVVMHVRFNKDAVVPADLKWKGVTLSQFDGKRWYNKPREMLVIVQRIPPGGQLQLARGEVSRRISGVERIDPRFAYETLTYHVVMQPIGTNAFFLIPRPLSLATDARDFTIDGAGTVGLNDPTRQITYYSGYSLPVEPSSELRQSAVQDFPEAVLSSYTELPANFDRRIPQLARDVTRNANSFYQKAAAIERYLQSSGTYGYTLELLGPADQNGDPLAHFLFVTKRGHCEYFASAMAIMLRSVGIPSRIANGFRGGELNDISGSYIVRARDAHSWVEAYIPGFGWASFDPTPASSFAPNTGWARMLLYVDAMREFWSEWVINYDYAHQNTLGEATLSRTRHTFDHSRIWLKDRYRALLNELRRSQRLVSRDPQKFGIRGVLAVFLFIILFNTKKLLRYLNHTRISRSPGKAPAHAASIWYERMTRLLGRRGIAKIPSQTPEEFLRTIDENEIRLSVAHFTEHYERARFGGSAEDAGKLPELYQDVAEHVKREHVQR